MIKRIATLALIIGSAIGLSESRLTAATSGVHIVDRLDANIEAVETDTDGEPIERGGAEVSAGQFIAPGETNEAFVLGTLGLDTENRFRLGTSVGGFVPGIGGELIGSYRLLTGDHPSTLANRTLTEHGFGVGYTSYFDKVLREFGITAVYSLAPGSDRLLNKSSSDVGAYRIWSQTNSGFGDTSSAELGLNLAFGTDSKWFFVDGYRVDAGFGYGYSEFGEFHSAPSREIDSVTGSIGLKVNTDLGTFSSSYKSGVTSDTFSVGYDLAMFRVFGTNRSYLDGFDEQNVGVLIRLDRIGKERDTSLFHKEKDQYTAPREMRHIEPLDSTLYTETPKVQTITTKTRELIYKPPVVKKEAPKPAPKPATTTPAAKPTTPSTGPVCGNKTCEAPTETSVTCAADCPVTGPVCGNNTCEAPTETSVTCAADCPVVGPVCGNNTCEPPTETSATCIADCPVVGPVCGNSTCESGETYETCSSDCPPPGPVCGNSTCESGETFESCASDCPPPAPECGNGTCELGEDSTTCALDCHPATECGNGSCEVGETAENCAPDCFISACGNGSCEIGEDVANCTADCGYCGDSICDTSEDPSTCSDDCGSSAECGNGFCEDGEDSETCSSDCSSGPSCGDGTCSATEDAWTCETDCAVCGDGTCDGNEAETCSSDCEVPAECGNGTCEIGEDNSSCSSDCSFTCNNSVCEPGEFEICSGDCS